MLLFEILIHQQGTCDQSNQIAAGAAVDFYNAVGGVQAAQEYVGPLLDWAQNMIAEALGTEKLAVPKSMEAPFMRCVGEFTHEKEGKQGSTACWGESNIASK